MTPPAIGPPVSKRYRVMPLRASSARKFPARSPVNSMLPAVGVRAAYIGVGQCTRQAILPLTGSTALIQPLHWLVGSFVPQPFASPVYGTVATHFGSGPLLNSVHQSIALTYRSPVCRL